MNKSKIEWTDYSMNPVKGVCPMACPYCYARRMYDRFHWDKSIVFDPDTLKLTGKGMKPGSKIFVGSTMELFGEWVQPEWIEHIFRTVREYQEYTFIFCTKRPERLAQWSPFPDNAWILTSVPGESWLRPAVHGLEAIQAPVKGISFEPLKGPVHMALSIFQERVKKAGINWFIIGQQTPANIGTSPKVEWVREIIQLADGAGIPVFLKDNLKPLLNGVVGVNAPFWYRVTPDHPDQDLLRQEFPGVK